MKENLPKKAGYAIILADLQLIYTMVMAMTVIVICQDSSNPG